MDKAQLEHIVKFEYGYDCIRFECRHGSTECAPGKGGSHGRAGLDIRFVSKGAKGAVQFLLSTGWLPQYAEQSSIGVRNVKKWDDGYFMPSDLGFHSKTPRYEGQNAIDDACEFCDGEPCYYDGSGLNAYDPMYALVNGGDDALWAFLDAYYASVFEDAEYPTPAEYPAAIRKATE